jgi:hypothetical protein
VCLESGGIFSNLLPFLAHPYFERFRKGKKEEGRKVRGDIKGEESLTFMTRCSVQLQE